MEAFSAGTLAGAGSFRCEECGFAVALHEQDELPTCPHCNTGIFKRASLFEVAEVAEPEHTEVASPRWLAQTRASLVRAGDYLAYEDESGVRVVRLTEEWTRLGRSLSADVRFDDPTVSRRHALLHRGDGVARVLDDRSLNGVFLNGERVEWSEISDGDEIAVGRFRLYFLQLAEDRELSLKDGLPALTN